MAELLTSYNLSLDTFKLGKDARKRTCLVKFCEIHIANCDVETYQERKTILGNPKNWAILLESERISKAVRL